MKVELSDKIYDDIKEYCRVNHIDDVDKFIKKIINQGFTTEKWGVIGENKEPKTEIIEKIIISAITTEPEIRIVEKIVYTSDTKTPEIRIVEKIVYSSDTKIPDVQIVEKIILSAITKEETKIIYSGSNKNVINYVYNINAADKKTKTEVIKQSTENIDIYGERKIRKI